MEKDKALRKILKTRDKGDLPYGFESSMMHKIMLEAKMKKRRSLILTLGLVSSVSFAMILGTIFLLHNYLSVKISMPRLNVQFSPEAGGMFGFFFYIAFLVLLLLALDHFFRGLRQRPKS